MNYNAMMQRFAATRSASAEVAREGLDRRSFMKLGAAGGFALGLFGVNVAAQEPAASSPGAGLKPAQQPSAFLRVEPNGDIVVLVNKLDFGQGVQTGLPMLVAEELDANWSKVRGELAPAGDAYKDPNFGIQMTGGSTSTHNDWQPYRELGARARAMFVAAAAQRFGVPAERVKLANGVASAGGKRATLGELAAEAMKQPVPEKVTLKEPKAWRLLGKPTHRLDRIAKTTGTQDFGIDVKQPGLKIALVTRPPVFGAKLASYDASRARAVPGVIEVLEVPLDRGASGLAVVAEGYWPAKQAREALELHWDTSGLEKPDSEKLFAQYRELAKQPGMKAREADTSALASAPRKLVAEYSFPYLAHAPMEPLNCTLHYSGDRCRVWAGSQFQTIDQATVAGVLGLKPEQVEFNTMMAGGGFGRRAVPTSDYIAEAAQVVKAWRAKGHGEPIKLMWSREDDIHGGYYRPMHVHRAEIGYDEQGKVLAWKHTIVGQSILAGTPFESFMVKNGIDAVTVEGVADTPYELPLSLEVHAPKVNVPVLWWRSVGNTHTAYVMETLIDELAHGAGKDPVAYRKALLGGKHPRHVAALDLAVVKSGYGKKQLPSGRAWGVALHESFGSVVAYVVQASLDNGQPVLHEVTAGVHCNFAVNPLAVEGQVQGAAIMALGTTLPGAEITFKDGAIQQNNFGEYPVPRISQAPKITVHIVPSAEPPTGMGEPGVPPLAPAFANAIAGLSGKRLRELPFKLT